MGIYSKGDPSKDFPQKLQGLVTQKFHAIVCATRTSGGTVEAVKHLAAAGYQITWKEKKRMEGAAIEAIEASDLAIAQTVVEMVELALGSG